MVRPLLVLLAAALAAAEGLAEGDALRQAFPQADAFVPERVQATPEQVRAVLQEAAANARGRQGQVYAALRGGRWVGTAYIDHVIGRTDYITWFCAIGRDGRIIQARVLTYREAIGGEVARPDWLAHFVGLAHADRVRRGRPIPNLAGATMSVDALAERCRLLLAWHETVVAPALAQRHPLPAGPATAPATRAIPVGGAFLTLAIDGAAPEAADALWERATAAAAAAELVVNQWSPASEAARLNAAGGGAPSTALGEVLDAIGRWHQRSGGAFDPTVGPLVAAWAAADGGDLAPDPTAFAHRLGWGKVAWDGQRLRLPPGLALDYGGLAKGWILDRVAAALSLPPGVTLHLDFGGSSRLVLGEIPCDLELADPRRPDRSLGRIALPPGRGFGAAHARGRTWRVAGTEHSHLIDPRRGTPTPLDRAAFVIAPDALTADLLDTAACILGVEEALALARTTGCELLRWDGDGFRATPGWPGGAPP